MTAAAETLDAIIRSADDAIITANAKSDIVTWTPSKLMMDSSPPTRATSRSE